MCLFNSGMSTIEPGNMIIFQQTCWTFFGTNYGMTHILSNAIWTQLMCTEFEADAP